MIKNYETTVEEMDDFESLVELRSKIAAAQETLNMMMQQQVPKGTRALVEVEVKVATLEQKIHNMSQQYRDAVLAYVLKSEAAG